MDAWTSAHEGRPHASGAPARRSHKGLDPAAITSRGWAKSLWSFSGRDGIVEYAINDRGYGRSNLPMSRDEQTFIRKTFQLLDRLTGLVFKEVSSLANSDIRVHCARKLGGNEGLAYKRKSWFHVYWKDKKGWDLTSFEKHLIRHEIGHALGLDHPYGSGGNSRYNTKDTVMSYNWVGNTKFTATDIQALQGLWGPESSGQATAAKGKEARHVGEAEHQAAQRVLQQGEACCVAPAAGVSADLALPGFDLADQGHALILRVVGVGGSVDGKNPLLNQAQLLPAPLDLGSRRPLDGQRIPLQALAEGRCFGRVALIDQGDTAQKQRDMPHRQQGQAHHPLTAELQRGMAAASQTHGRGWIGAGIGPWLQQGAHPQQCHADQG